MRKSQKSKRDEREFQACYEELEQLQEQADDGKIALYYFDVAGFSLEPAIPYAWQEKGSIIEIPSARSSRINVLGFFNTDNDFQSFIFQSSVDTSLIVDCFNMFAKTISQKTVVVIDNAPTHTSDEFEDWIEEWKQMGLFIKYLPEYSPELNLIEILWRKIKYEWIPFSAYLNFSSLKNSIIDILAQVGTKYTISFA